MDELLGIYNESIPSFLEPYLSLETLQRLEDIGMNCGLEYTSLPFFSTLPRSTRFHHSLGVALIAYHFKQGKKEALAGLLHDIATPCFAHVIDFLNGDHETQESTEDSTRFIIENDKELCSILRSDGLGIDDVVDYSMYPVCDNHSPHLSADRLEYTLRNIIYFGFADAQTVEGLYQNLELGTNEFGEEEIIFSSIDKALEFGFLAMKTSEVYVCNEDRFSMEDLAHLIGKAIQIEAITKEDLTLTETKLIEKLTSNPKSKALWEHFRSLSKVIEVGSLENEHTYQVKSKLRYIDPYVKGLGRLSRLSDSFKDLTERFQRKDFSIYLSGVYSSR